MKKVFLILLTVILVLCMAACDQASVEPTEPSTEPATQATESKPIVPITSDTPTLTSGYGCGGDTTGSEE